jgi:hypothetical protein
LELTGLSVGGVIFYAQYEKEKEKGKKRNKSRKKTQRERRGNHE